MLIKQFRCYAAGCGKYSPFDVHEAAKNKNIEIECIVCGKKWIGSILNQTCCFVRFNFTSIEKSSNKSLKKIQSFNLKR